MKKEKGITLIALIITIIVMLILVGVTINVALNGGLFAKAKEAAQKTEKQTIYEQIIDKMEITADGKIDVKGTFQRVVAEFGENKVKDITPTIIDENTTEVTFSIEGKTGVYKYKITNNVIEIIDNAKKPTDKIYSFRLNDLGEWSSTTETGFVFEPDVVWNIVGEDLSKNNKYYIASEDSKQLVLESDDNRFAGYADYTSSGGSLESNVQFLVIANLYNEDGKVMFYIEVFDATGSPMWNTGNDEGYSAALEFKNTYGDVVFKFVDVSSIGM